MSMTRRTALAMTGAGMASALTGFAAHAAGPVQNSPTLADLIRTHKAAHQRINAICSETDPGALGRSPTKAALVRWRRASSAEYRAIADVCCHRPRSAAEARAKSRYIRDYHRKNDLDDENVLWAMLKNCRRWRADDANLSRRLFLRSAGASAAAFAIIALFGVEA
jgi:hypothetical protein